MTTCTLETLKGLVESTPAESLLLNLDAYYAQRTLPATGVDSEVKFDCPRTQMMVRTAVKGTTVGTHFHTVCDEYVIVVGGRGEIHVCPRGIIHDTRALAEDLRYLSIFTPHTPPGTDINWV